MSVDTKACTICGKVFKKRPNLSRKDFERVQTCGKPCASKLRLQRMYPDGQGRKIRDRISEGAYNRARKNQAMLLQEGKRAAVESCREWDIDHVNTKTKAYQDQLAIDTAWRESLNCKAGPVKVYTPQEIEAIRHQITHIDHIKRAEKETILFAEPDPTFKRIRHEESGSLFARRDN